ncbi:hypothetical protein CRG98_029805 [Punica granatum]|uniref:Uncharacterized protein n=1 Tax=Punica granatum TaxID=22663 RepID=A0A2I0J0Q5_PUNGR|nr:hypothetical protein CRG98_029805 [Punica granatum]
MGLLGRTGPSWAGMGRDAAGGLSWATGRCLCCWVGRGRRGAIRMAERRAKGAMVELETRREAEGKRESELRDGARGELGGEVGEGSIGRG